MSSSTNKPYMSYRAITDTSSTQYQLMQRATTDTETGLMYIDGYLCVALGSKYGPVGTKYLMTIGGVDYKVIKVDAKQDRHTTNGEGWTAQNGSILEMVVNMSYLDNTAMYMGDCNCILNGQITKILREK